MEGRRAIIALVWPTVGEGEVRAARVAAASALAFVVLNNAIAGGLFAVIYDFDIALVRESGALVGRGTEPAALLRIASFVDLLGYLALTPAVLEIGRRVGRPLVTAAGVSAIVVGAIGAAVIGAVGPFILESSAAGAEAAAAARLAFGALEKAVIVGLWGTLELFLFGVALAGVAWALRERGRAFAVVSGLAGAGAFAYAARSGLTGQTPLALEGPLDLAILVGISLLPVWTLWLALWFWRG